MNEQTALRFLIVDGLAGVQAYARQLLEAYGFDAANIRTAADPEAALALAQDFRPDLLITDSFPKSMLPGAALHQRLLASHPACRLALLSFELTPEVEAQAQEAQALFLLRKPFTAQELRDRLHKALEQLARERPELTMPAPQGARPARPIQLPAVDPIKPGDRVRVGDQSGTVQYVLIRHGELAVQLKGQTDFIPADRVRKA